MNAEKTWISGENGNRASVEYWGSEEAARESLKTLEDCENCSDCSRCSRCSDCSRCSYCSDCSRCSRCSYCSDCSDCSCCSYCSRCSYCSDCSGCSRCSCCSRCSYCSGCSRCSYCSGCSRCSGCDRLKNAKPTEGEAVASGPPEVPMIPDIHKRVLEAIQAPGCSLDMATWHKCETTHCRAGWVVHLAGEAGRKLESFYGTPHAAFLIYRESDPGLKAYPDFYCGNAEALADMRRLAGVAA